MNNKEIEYIYKYKPFFRHKYKKLKTETFNDLFHDALETLLQKQKSIHIEYPKSYFGFLLKGKISNYKTNKTRKNTIYIKKYKEISAEPEYKSFGNIIKEINNFIQELPKQQKLIAKEFILNNCSYNEISEQYNIKYMTTKANVRHILAKIKKKLKHLK